MEWFGELGEKQASRDPLAGATIRAIVMPFRTEVSSRNAEISTLLIFQHFRAFVKVRAREIDRSARGSNPLRVWASKPFVDQRTLHDVLPTSTARWPARCRRGTRAATHSNGPSTSKSPDRVPASHYSL
jgi:hypothetical protein